MPTTPRTPENISSASMPELVSGLFADAKEIAAGHFGRMRGEIKDEFRGLKQYLAKVAVAIGVGILGAILLAHTAALVLDALGLPQWLGYLIAAALALVAGLVILKRLPGETKDIDLVPESTLADFRRDVKSLRSEVAEEARGGRPIGAY